MVSHTNTSDTPLFFGRCVLSFHIYCYYMKSAMVWRPAFTLSSCSLRNGLAVHKQERSRFHLDFNTWHWQSLRFGQKGRIIWRTKLRIAWRTKLRFFEEIAKLACFLIAELVKQYGVANLSMKLLIIVIVLHMCMYGKHTANNPY